MFKRYLMPGLLIWIPILGTYYTIKFTITLMDQMLALIPAKYQPDHLLGFHIPGLGLVLTLIILFLTGLIATNFIGRKVIFAWEKLMDHIPLVRKIYAILKQITEAILRPKSASFRKVVLIEWPRQGTWSIAFVTGDTNKETPQHSDYLTIFVPTPPNPTNGFLAIMQRSQVHEVNLPVEEALKMCFSLGIISSEGIPGVMEQVKNGGLGGIPSPS